MASYNPSQQTIKGILKKKSSIAASSAASLAAKALAQQSRGTTEVKRKKTQRWDESNIQETYRSLYRDYDFMKINEPSTSHFSVQDDGEDTVCALERKDATEDLTVDILAKKFAAIDTSEPDSERAHTSKIFSKNEEKKQQFELKRKMYNDEALNIKLARQLIARDFECEEMEDVNKRVCLRVTNEEKTPAEPGPSRDKLQTQPQHV